MTLGRSSIEPFLQFSARRDLRENAYRAWSARGESGGASDNRAIAAEMVKLRAERARLLGYESFAHYRLADTMAKTPQNALDLLELVWASGVASARKDEEALQAIATSEGGNFKIAPWDWRYLAEKRRQAEFDLDEAELKPYLQLDRMIEAAFYAAGRLFGLKFVERSDVKLYDPDVRAWEVIDRGGEPIALFIGDYFARPSKRSGAWMSNFRGQQKLDGATAADRRQRDEFRQGRPRRSESHERRRCADAVPRIRPRSAWACCPTSPIQRFPAPMSRAISWSFPRSSTSIG